MWVRIISHTLIFIAAGVLLLTGLDVGLGVVRAESVPEECRQDLTILPTREEVSPEECAQAQGVPDPGFSFLFGAALVAVLNGLLIVSNDD